MLRDAWNETEAAEERAWGIMSGCSPTNPTARTPHPIRNE